MSKNLGRENKLFPKKGNNLHYAKSRQKADPVFLVSIDQIGPEGS